MGFRVWGLGFRVWGLGFRAVIELQDMLCGLRFQTGVRSKRLRWRSLCVSCWGYATESSGLQVQLVFRVRVEGSKGQGSEVTPKP